MKNNNGIISYSKINVCNGCEFAYYLGYIKRVQVPESPFYAFGKRVHSLVKMFWTTNYKSADSFAKQFGGIWTREVNQQLKNQKPIGFNNKDQPFIFYNLGRKMLRNFFAKNIDFRNCRIDLITKRYDLGHKSKKEVRRILRSFDKQPLVEMQKIGLAYDDLPGFLVERKVNFLLNGNKMVSVFDRVDLEDGRAEIVDYKTDFNTPRNVQESDHMNQNNFQFVLYPYAYQKVFKRPAQMFLYYLRSGEVFRLKPNDNPEEFLIAYIERFLQNIKKGDFVQNASKRNCESCKYLGICGQLNDETDKLLGLEKLIKDGLVEIPQKARRELEKSKVQLTLF